MEESLSISFILKSKSSLHFSSRLCNCVILSSSFQRKAYSAWENLCSHPSNCFFSVFYCYRWRRSYLNCSSAVKVKRSAIKVWPFSNVLNVQLTIMKTNNNNDDVCITKTIALRWRRKTNRKKSQNILCLKMEWTRIGEGAFWLKNSIEYYGIPLIPSWLHIIIQRATMRWRQCDSTMATMR